MTHHPRRPAMVQRPIVRAPIVLPLLPPEALLQSARGRVDTLSDVLRAVRLTGAVFFAIDASSPWVSEAPPAAAVAALHHAFFVEHVIEYHVVTASTRWIHCRSKEILPLSGHVPPTRIPAWPSEERCLAPPFE